MAALATNSEEAQLTQTIEMFEVITQSQPQDYQSLEILKEAYAKLGRESEVVKTSKRIAEAYVLMGQLSSAILEYESVLQRHPDDPDALAALGEIENKANSLNNAEVYGRGG
jgi:tetratricopeptide (TPR) repeat protein